MRRVLAAAALIAVTLGLTAPPAAAVDTGASVDRGYPDPDGDIAYCAVETPNGTTIVAPGQFIAIIRCQFGAVDGTPEPATGVQVYLRRTINGTPNDFGNATCQTGLSWASNVANPNPGQFECTFTWDISGTATYVWDVGDAGAARDCEVTAPGQGTQTDTNCDVVLSDTSDYPADYFAGGVPGVTPLNEYWAWPDYDCSRSVELIPSSGGLEVGTGYNIRANADEILPAENATANGAVTSGPFGEAILTGNFPLDRYLWYVEWMDPDDGAAIGLTGSGRWQFDALGPRTFPFNTAAAGDPVDVANGYLLWLKIERTAPAGYGFQRPIPNNAEDEAAYTVERVGDHEVATGYCRMGVNFDNLDQESHNSTTGTHHPPNPHDWGDGGSGSLSACVPSGLSILSPAALVEGLGCTLRWAFLPTSDKVQGVLNDFEEQYDERFPFSMVGQLYGMVDTTIDAAQDGLDSTSCPHIDLRGLHPSLASYSQLDVKAPTPTGSGCAGAGGVAGDIGGWRSWMRTGMRFALWFMVMVGLSRRLGPKDDGPILVGP